jgi:hypothetical protein
LYKVSAQGSASKYNFIDTRPLDNNNYYRLKIEDIDGSFEYSSVIHQKFEQKNYTWAYYRPASKEIEIRVNPLPTDAHIQLVNVQGTIVRQISEQDSELKWTIYQPVFISFVYQVPAIDY